MIKPKRRLFIIVMMVAVIGLYLVVRVTGILRSFSIPTASSQPTLKVGQTIWVSSLASPKRYDHIVFTYYDSMAERKEYRVFRLCGIPGDTVEIKNGDLFVNNRNTAGMFDCCFPYQVDAVELLTLNQLLKLPEEDIGMQSDKGKVELILNKTQLDQVKKLKIPVERKITPKFEKDEMISRIFGQPWNIDHFGPLVIPADRYFVLGDNRHRAQDSRYIGLIPTSDLYGTVISK